MIVFAAKQSTVQSAAQSLIVAGGSIIEAMAAIVIAYSVSRALGAALLKRDSDAARLYIAQGVVAALGFSLAGTLLKTIALQTWSQIRVFAFVLILRTSLKRVFLWEEQAIRRRAAPSRLPHPPKSPAAPHPPHGM